MAAARGYAIKVFFINGKNRGWKRNNWISLIHYSIHFFLSYSLFLIQFCSIFIIPFQVILYSFAETV